MRKQNDTDFIQNRTRLAAWWNWAGGAMLLFLAGAFAWLFFTTRHLVDPFMVDRVLNDRSIHWATVEGMAVALPVVMLLLFAVTATLILFGFGAMAVERRYLRIIDELRRKPDQG
jgi:hypothetical protein